MLKTIDFTDKRNSNRPTVLLLGGFDGLHVGHKRLLARAKSFGYPVGIMSIVGGKKEKSLFTEEERAAIFARGGADFSFTLPFSEIREWSAERFVDVLRTEYAPEFFVCGEDFRFGYQAQGTPELLKTRGQVCVEPPVCMHGEKVSATMIKHLLATGDLSTANKALGEAFFLTGRVFRDRGVGRTIDFPTANVRYPKDKFPLKQGVYQTRTIVDGKAYDGITNYGARPTFDDDDVLTETYLDGFSGDLYDRKITIEFVRFLRDIRKFDGLAALRAQLQEDIRRVRTND